MCKVGETKLNCKSRRSFINWGFIKWLRETKSWKGKEEKRTSLLLEAHDEGEDDDDDDCN